MPSRFACDRYTPHLFLSNNRCRDCDYLQCDHVQNVHENARENVSKTVPNNMEDRIQALVRSACSTFEPHAWLLDRCRDCGRSEMAHESAAASHTVEQSPTVLQSKRGSFKVKNEAEIAQSVASAHKPASNHHLAVKGAVQSINQSLNAAINQMVQMHEEFDELQSQNTSDTLIEQFKAKEAELIQQVEQLKSQLQSIQQPQPAVEQPRASVTDSVINTSINQLELEIARLELEEAKREVLELQAALNNQQSASQVIEHVVDEQSVAAQDEPITQSKPVEEEKTAVDEEIEEPVIVINQSNDPVIEQRNRAVSHSVQQPAVNQTEENSQLSEVLMKVEKLFLQGKNYVRVLNQSNSEMRYQLISLFLRLIDGQYHLCWSKKGDRTISLQSNKQTINQSSCVPINQIKCIILGTTAFNQSSNGKWNQWMTEPSNQARCVSIIYSNQPSNTQSINQSINLIAANDRSAEMTVFGLASLIKQSISQSNNPENELLVFDQLGGQAAEDSVNQVINQTIKQSFNDGIDGVSIDQSLDCPVDWWVDCLTDCLTDQPVKQTIELSVRCSNLPLTRGCALVCLVDQAVEQSSSAPTNQKWVYIGQTELATSTNPAFKQTFTVDAEEWIDQAAAQSGNQSVPEVKRAIYGIIAKSIKPSINPSLQRTIKFNVYDLSANQTTIEDSHRLGSLSVSLCEPANNQSVNMVYKLTHTNPAKMTAINQSHALLTVQCTSKQICPASMQAIKQSNYQSVDELHEYESMLLAGSTFTVYSIDQANNQNKQQVFIKYVKPTNQQSIEQLGSLQMIALINQGAPSENDTMRLKAICDVYVGAKSPSFMFEQSNNQINPSHCFSLVTRAGQRWDLEWISQSNEQTNNRDVWVTAIIELLKYSSLKARERATKQLGL